MTVWLILSVVSRWHEVPKLAFISDNSLLCNGPHDGIKAKLNNVDMFHVASGVLYMYSHLKHYTFLLEKMNCLMSFLLGEDDISDVMEAVMDVAAKWKALGGALRLRPPDLDTIKGDPTECLRDMLLAWLQQRYDVKQYGAPSWDMLTKAVGKRSGGDNPALEEQIATMHRRYRPV